MSADERAGRSRRQRSGIRTASRSLSLLVVLALWTTGCGATTTPERAAASLEAYTVADPSGRDVEIIGLHGACDEVQVPEIVETPYEIRVRIFLVSTLEDGEACESIGLPLISTVTLAEPLGDRPVIDAETGRPLPIDGSDEN